ncbi:DUF11 domain-containing protein [Planctomyces sp. SH-PL14]|uniref:DUF11 domain-containing protein n=1 Tax=Planctomyces sp. SH-PL14 TaxID=1632864 RepID=UPI00078B4A69|nr:DUF11 domain-containing protein [Planctomyces sp. SH-PL14]AMV17048.1 Large cysteine-rich periplasmic protein OmcB precursor [Planctomyces sp. SH-PL14]
MIAAIWKSAALAGVIGVGCGGVYYVQRDLATTSIDPGKFGELDPGIQGEPADALTTADPVGITSVDIPPAKAELGETSPLALPGAATLGSADEPPPQNEVLSGEPASADAEPSDKDLLAVADSAGTVTDAGLDWAGDRKAKAKEIAPAAAVVGEESLAVAPKDELKSAAANAGNPWADLADTPAPKTAPKRAAANSGEVIDLVASSDEAGPVAGAADNKLTALPSGHPGPVLMEVPEKSARPRHVAEDLFLPDIGGQSEPVSAQAAAGQAPAADALAAVPQEIQQVQNELPEIRPARSRSSIPTANNGPATPALSPVPAPELANPFSQRDPAANAAAAALPTIAPSGSTGNLTRTAIAPPSEQFTPAGGPITPAAGVAEPTPAAGRGNPFAGDLFAQPPAATPANAPNPTAAPAAAQPFGAAPMERSEPAPFRSTIPGAGPKAVPVSEPGFSGGAAPFTAPPSAPLNPSAPPIQGNEPQPFGGAPVPTPAATPSAFPGNRGAIPELNSIPGPTPATAPAAAPAPAANPLRNAPPATNNVSDFGGLFPANTPAPGPGPGAAETNPNPNAFSPAGTMPPRREPVIDLVGDGTVATTVASGPQQPEIKIEKIAPAEAVVGEPLIYEIKVRNVGQSTAHRVVVEDRIPLGATCQGTIPQAETADKRLFWKLGDMRPSEERSIKVKLTPTQAGSIGSVATVNFAAEVAATTVVTAPELKVELQAPKQIIVGEQSVFRVRVVNSGQGLAKGVFIRALLPKELQHPGGNDLEYEIGNLSPKQSKDVELHVAATAQGVLTPKVIVSTNNQEQDARTVQVSVIDTRIKVARTGPAKRFVGRPASYTNTVTNQSLDTLRDVQVVENVPRDLEPTGRLSSGQWDPQNRTITWRIPQLAPGEHMELPIDLIPKKPGTFDGTLQVADAGGNKANIATRVDVAGYSNLVVDVVPDGPVAVGEQVSMRLSVRNRGTAPASNVQTVFEVPGHLRFVNAQGPVQHQAAGNVVHFAALDVIPPGGEQEFDIVLAAAEEGNARVKVDLYSDDHKSDPLHEEGEVRVYRDGGR